MQLIRQKNYMELAKTDEQKSLISVISSGNKISAYQKSEMGEIIELIGKWRFMVGINTTIDPIELIALSEFLQKNYGQLTVQEINLAINLSLKNVLAVDNKPYGSFSALYVSSILNAYIDYKQKIAKEINEIADLEHKKQMLEQKSIPPPAKKRAEDMIEILKNAYTTYKTDEIFTDPFSFIYDFLKKKGVFSKFDKETIRKIKSDALKFSKSTKNKVNTPFLSDWEKPKNEQDVYISKGKHIFCEKFFSSFSTLADFESVFLKTITEKDFL